MTAIGAREAIVAAAPFAAGAYAAIGLPVNLRGLAHRRRRARGSTTSGDKKILLVEGAIVNLRQGETAAPDLRIALARGRRARALCLDDARAEERGWRAGSACASPRGSPRRRRESRTRW